jgi:hypothetical protein
MNNHDDRILHLLTQIGHLVGENYKNEMSSKLNDIKFNVFFKFSFYLFGLLQNFNPNTSENRGDFENLFFNELKYFVSNNGGPNIINLDLQLNDSNFTNKIEDFFKSYFTINGSENQLPFDYVIDSMNIVNGINNMSMHE